MSKLPKIDSAESLRAWLEVRSHEDAVLIAHRAAMRVAPIWFAEMDKDWARIGDLTALSVLRANLVSGVASKYPSQKIRNSTSFSAQDVNDSTRIAISVEGVSAAISSAHAAADAVFTSELSLAASPARGRTVSFAISSIGHGVVAIENITFSASAVGLFWNAVQTDVHALIRGEDASILPLWPDENPLAAEWERSKPILRATPGGDFWIDWYQRALDGRPQNWPLLHDIALIDDALWKRGGNALAQEINRIVERHRLLKEVRRLKAELAEARKVPAVQEAPAAITHRGHNQPPELLSDDPTELIIAVDEIEKQLDNAEEELRLSQPSPSRLKWIGQQLLDAVRKTIAYVRKLSNITLITAGAGLGKVFDEQGGTALLDWVRAHGGELIELAKNLPRLAGMF